MFAKQMDEHALGAPLGAWKEGYSGSYLPLEPHSVQWLLCRGRNAVRNEAEGTVGGKQVARTR